MTKLVRDLAQPRGTEARISIDTIIVDGHSIPNLKAPPDEWRLGRACPKRAEYAAALGWTKLFFPPSSHVAYTWLLDRMRAIIVPAHLPFYLPNEPSIHRSLVFWRHAKYGVGVDGLDERTCLGIKAHEQRITCCPAVCADGSKLISLAGEDLIVLTIEQLSEMQLFGTIKMGCWEGWNSDGSYSHPINHHPAFCFLDEALRATGAPPEPRTQAL